MDLFVIKRDGWRIPCSIKWIQKAIFTAAKSGQQKSINHAAEVTNKVKRILSPEAISTAHNIAVLRAI